VSAAAPVRRRPRSLVVLRSSYVTSLKKAGRHIRYICFRARELPEHGPGIFSRDRDTADVGQFIRSLDDPKTRDPKNGRPVAKLHKMTFSMRGRDFERCGFTSWKPIIRQAMANVERQLGRRLEWVAAEHMTRSHPHCHVALKAVSYDRAGRGYRLRIDKAALRLFKGEVTRLVMRELERVRAQERMARQQIQYTRRAFRTVNDLLGYVREVQRRRQQQEAARLREIQRQRDQERGGRGR
jgi:hypothetical protein